MHHWQYPPVSQFGLVASGAKRDLIGQQRDVVSVVMTLLLVHQFVRSLFQNKEAHKSVGMVFCCRDSYSSDVLQDLDAALVERPTGPQHGGVRDSDALVQAVQRLRGALHRGESTHR